MRRKAALTITLAALSLFVFSPHSSQKVHGEYYSVNQVLATSITQWNQQNLTTLQWQGVDWVISYDTIVNSSFVAAAHSLGLKVMVYVTALKEGASAPSGLNNGYTTITPQKSWAQVANDSAKTVMYPDPIANEYWFSPYSPYTNSVTIPRIYKNLQLGADGIFLDTLILYADSSGRFADNSTYANHVWKTKYPTDSYQQFRYQSLHDDAKRIYTAMHNATSPNSNAVLMISDNNVCDQPSATEIQLRAKYGSEIDQWQDSADGFVLEYVGMIENNNPSNPTGEAQAIINVWSREKSTYGVSKPMWLIGFTNRDDVFNYLQSNSVTQGFGYWAYANYLLQPNLIIYQGQPYHFSIQSNSSLSNLKFDTTRRLINFSVTGAAGTTGYVNAVVPIALLNGPPIIMLNNQQITPTLLNQNSTHYTIKINYHHSTQQVSIGGAYTIPEFPNFLLLPISATILLAATWIIRKRAPANRPHNTNASRTSF